MLDASTNGLAVGALFAALAFGCSSNGKTTAAPDAGTPDAGGPDAGPPTCTIAEPALADGHLTTDGTRLRDTLGRVVILRGVNAGGRSKFAPYVPFDFAQQGFTAALGAYMDRAASWGVNVMRVPFVWAAVEPTQGTDDAAFLANYDAIHAAAWARGIRTVVDFHQDLYAENLCGDGFPAWTLPGTPPPPMHDCMDWQLQYFQNPAVQAAFDRFWASGSTAQASFVALWKRMAARYASAPGVVGLEVFNEPSNGTASAGPFEMTTLTAFYSMMVPILRAAAPNKLVFVDPLGVDGASLSTTLQKPMGDGIVFAPHFYPLLDQPSMVVSELSTSWVPVSQSWNVPLWVGEFGLSHDATGAQDYISGVFDAFDALGIGGTAWEYSVAAEEWNFETDSIVAADGTEYPVATAVIRPFARAVAADAFTSGFDTGSSTFTLAYTPAGSAVTEVSLPARAYPKGFDVELSGACVDSSHAGELLLKADAGATKVSLTVRPK